MQIKFIPQDELGYPQPKPALHFMEDWFKALPPEITGEVNGKKCPIVNDDGTYARTVKACMPFLDALSMGYIIPLPVDVGVRPDPNRPDEGPGSKNMLFNWKTGGVWSSHNGQQVEGMDRCLVNPGKWMNPWLVKTPKGYSCLFTHPLNHTNLPFRTLSGVVDTDDYYNEVNFPFDWIDPDFEGVLKAGTPMIQVIPFKREAWVGKTLRFTQKHNVSKKSFLFRLNSILKDSYKTLSWHKKSYK